MQNNLKSDEKADSLFFSDAEFNQLYPLHIQKLAQKHWTPLYVAKKAAHYLATNNGAKILDVGSGVGKFCLAAAHYRPNISFYGIEQRQSLIFQANKVKDILQLKNVEFIQGNFTQLNFQEYDHFYFYNSFYENLVGTDKIDHSISYSAELYHYYTRYLYKQLEKMPEGTRLVTFHSLGEEIPSSYLTVGTELDNQLKFWVKI